MRRVAIIMFILLILTSPVLAEPRQIPLNEVRESDEGYYIFFSALLKLYSKSLDDVLDENLNGTSYERLGLILNFLIEEQNERLRHFLPPFLELYKGIGKIVEGQRVFFKGKMLSGVAMMKEGISESELALSDIEGLEFKTENDVKRLNVGEVRDKLERVKDLVSTYEFLVKKKLSENITLALYVSDENPFIYENVTFYGIARNFSEVTVHVGNESFKVKVVKGEFSLNYTFYTPGVYIAYAEAGNIRSNVLRINVTRIPTRIIVPKVVVGRIFQDVIVNGSLVDYMGNPIQGNLITSIGNVSVNGSFSIKLRYKKYGNYVINLYYPGNNIYESSEASVRLVILRLPVTIRISSEREKVRAGKEFRVYGNVSVDVPIELCVDGNCSSIEVENGSFNATLSINDVGEHEIYAYFKGNEMYEPAKSNVIIVEVYSYPVREIAVAVLLLFLVFLILRLRPRKMQGIEIGGEIEELLKREEVPEGTPTVRDSYRRIYFTLIRKFNLGRSTTPRELLNFLKDKPFWDHLAKVTMGHEKEVYAGRRLSLKEVKAFFRALGNLMLTLILGEEP
ncbi:hypothetical protein PNA2_1010 [Pyrococcus sp. NA2]|uniref:Ig-like domain repeat protein n=1 Tax=Pyrococcus sp. (strain NA2) TaxID=342949 RepID=UPI000209A9F1|nr:Ig-like domain repeat protein [Pyrococcus sp. NA2]AEC51926.1 hypothetical protein PNA2_1010 [Pyrococcus sp. NA2]